MNTWVALISFSRQIPKDQFQIFSLSMFAVTLMCKNVKYSLNQIQNSSRKSFILHIHMITRPGDKNIGANTIVLWFPRMKGDSLSFLHLSSPNQDALIWSNVILIYHFSAAGKTLSSPGLFEKLLDTKTDPGNFAHAVNQSDTPECPDPNSLFFVYGYQTTSPILSDNNNLRKNVNGRDLFMFFNSFLLFSTRDGWWERRVSVVRGWASKPGREVCDGEGSWCLCAGHGHRQGLSCPAVRTRGF